MIQVSNSIFIRNNCDNVLKPGLVCYLKEMLIQLKFDTVYKEFIYILSYI